ncbi:MAG: UDP-N-acetylmuramoyl-L-alanyl-D-glutamate--2,6-diaminopimelate ligase [bacterium]
MRLGDLLEGLEAVICRGDPSVEISDLAYDSRKVKPGSLFFAVPGLHLDGRQFAGQAVARGARAVLSDSSVAFVPGAAMVQVADVRQAMARVAARFFGDPSRRLTLIGVTGTNGKTTFTYLMESILKEAGFRAGVIGTIQSRCGDRVYPSRQTTPEAVDLQRTLHEMLEAGATHALLEVSSHGLDYGRVDACQFSCAVFTNLGRDHLDHHGSLESYFLSKARLFTELLPCSEAAGRRPTAVVSREDPYGRRLIGMSRVPMVTVGSNGDSDYRIGTVACGRNGISVEVLTPGGALTLDSALLAEVNAQNIALAAATADRLGIGREAIARGVAALKRVPGRLEKVETERDLLVLIDYAHTPDALEKVLAGLRKLAAARLITVFGCGGDRDRGKRPLMGAVTASYSDLAVVTSDNPRSEPPERIIEEILQGVRARGVPYLRPESVTSSWKGQKAHTAVADRRQAIRLALEAAAAGDIVLVAGKGHEGIQIVGGAELPFSDRREVLEVLEGNKKGEKGLG